MSEMKRLQVQLPAASHKRIKKIATDMDISMSDLGRIAIEEYLKRNAAIEIDLSVGQHGGYRERKENEDTSE